MLKYALGIIIVVVYLSGCSSVKPTPAEIKEPTSAPVAIPAPEPEPPIEAISPLTDLLDKLMAQYKEWKGTRYRMGSHSKSGTDCSGFVLMTFREQFGIELPRSTREQNKLGQDVKKTDLVSGDLVFFHTGRYDHVGIYLQDGQFLHASTRAGVKISKLTEPYWMRTYWKAKRLNLTQNHN